MKTLIGSVRCALSAVLQCLAKSVLAKNFPLPTLASYEKCTFSSAQLNMHRGVRDDNFAFEWRAFWSANRGRCCVGGLEGITAVPTSMFCDRAPLRPMGWDSCDRLPVSQAPAHAVQGT